jgi:3-deoxy-D-manno-octulosonate 8-phosphate phosphatase KdsC-like HAD superfamily phosphatase
MKLQESLKGIINEIASLDSIIDAIKNRQRVIIYYDGDEVIDTEMMSAVAFLKKVQEGDYKLENEITYEEISIPVDKVNNSGNGFIAIDNSFFHIS